MNFYIQNGAEEQVAVLSSDSLGSHTAISKAIIDEKIGSFEQLELVVDASKEEAIHLSNENIILFKDLKGWREYNIIDVADYDSDSKLERTVIAELSSSELIDETIETNLYGVSSNPKVVLTELLKGTRWSVGIVDESIYNKSFNVDTKYMNVLEVLSELTNSYNCEAHFSYEINQGKVVARKVNLYKQFGKNNGKRFEVDKDIIEIERVSNTEDIKTAIIAYTEDKVEKDENDEDITIPGLTLAEVEWSKAKGDPADKPLGQNWLGDPTALSLWGRPNADGTKRHRKLSMKIEVDSAEALISMAWMQLGRYTLPKMTYTTKAINLYDLTGDKEYIHEAVSLGDTVVAIDKYFSEPIIVETRVVEATRNLLDPSDNEYVFGTSKATLSTKDAVDRVEDIEKDFSDIKNQVDSIQINADGKTRTFRGSKTPIGAREGDLWFRPHPTKPGERQMLVHNGTAWELESDSSSVSLVKNDLLVVKKETQNAIDKAQEAVDKADDVEGALQFKVDSKDYEAKMTLLDNNINLRVEKDDIIHQINVSDEQILIQGDKIIISGDTTVDGTFKITNEMIALGVSADKINVGTLNGKTVNIINLNADNITGGNLDMQNITMKNGDQTILSINQDGEVVLNVSHMKIGMFDAITTEDLKKLESQYTFILTNDSATIPTDSAGNNGDFSQATTQPIMYKLGVVDSSWTITASPSAGVVGTFSGGKYTITNMTSKSGSVVFTAKKDSMTLTKVFKIAKALAGSNGAKGDKGDTGASGKDGIAGKDGVGVKSTAITYSQSTSGTTAPTSSWSTSVPTLVKGQYLWTKTTWTYTDNSTETGYTVSYNAKDGNTGKDGIAGKDGVGIKSTNITYAGSTSGTATPTSGWTTAVPTVAQGSFLWTRTIWTYTDNTTETGYSVARMGSNGATGATGAQGASATSYWITASNNIIGKSQTGILSPTTITFTGYSKTGTANSALYAGRFIIQTSTNGTTYATKYTSSANQNAYTYTIPADTKFIKALFYQAGGTSVLLDEQTVPVVESAEGIEIGDRNLLPYKTMSEYSGGKLRSIEDKVEVNGSKITIKKALSDLVGFSINVSSFKGKELILSALSDNNTLTTYHSFDGGTTQINGPLTLNNGVFTRIIKVPENATTLTLGVGRYPHPATFKEYWLDEVQLRYGNKYLPWSPAPEDARTYKAWANSSDGSADFTRVYPNENLIRNSSNFQDTSYWTQNGGTTLSVEDGYLSVKSSNTTGQYRGVYTTFDITGQKNNKLTITTRVKKGSTDTSNEKFSYIWHYLRADGSMHSQQSSSGVYQISLTDEEQEYSFSATLPNTDEIVTVRPIFQRSMAGGVYHVLHKWMKAEIGEQTIYTTNTADSLTGSIPKYVGFSPIDSDASHEYEWIMNPEYAQALADEALAGKVDNDAEYENLKNMAEEVKESYEKFVGENGEYKTEHKKLLERTTAVETDLGVYKQQINFVDTYMSAGNEGLIIGMKDSKGKPDTNAMQMLLSNKSLSFMDGGEVVAYFSGQSFHINRGAIVDSLQIGQHKITNLGNGHTVFQFTG